MLKTMRTALLAGAAVALATVASAQTYDPDISALDQKCVQATSKALVKFTGAKAKCGSKCIGNARKSLNPVSDCYAPYAGTTATCVYDPVKGAEAKNIAAIKKKCDEVLYPGKVDCPECYSGGDCDAYSGSRTSSTEAEIDVFGPLVWCDPLNPDKGIQKCQDNVAKVLVKFVGCKNKCYDKCYANQAKGLTNGSCTPPSPGDTATNACIFDALKGCEAKAAAGIDKLCALFSQGDKNPPCYAPFFDTGSEWVALTESAIDGNVPETYCGSPSGAFLAD
jgi:hypothetical protein